MAHFKMKRKAWERLILFIKPAPLTFIQILNSLAKLKLYKRCPATNRKKGSFRRFPSTHGYFSTYKKMYSSNIRLTLLLMLEFRKLINLLYKETWQYVQIRHLEHYLLASLLHDSHTENHFKESCSLSKLKTCKLTKIRS